MASGRSNPLSFIYFVHDMLQASVVEGAHPTATGARCTGQSETLNRYPEIWSGMESQKVSLGSNLMTYMSLFRPKPFDPLPSISRAHYLE